MREFDLTIRRGEWYLIYLLGLLVGAGLGLMLWQLGIGAPSANLFTGAASGLAITLFASLFVEYLNPRLASLPAPLAYGAGFVFTFLSGFLGFLAVYALLTLADAAPALATSPWLFAATVGLLTYLIGFTLYLLVQQKNRRDALQKDLTQARLAMLEEQLNPHFLFNALNAVSATMYKDVDTADRAILKLASLLRKALDGSSLIPLQEELEHCRDLVWLHALQCEAKITLTYDIPDALEKLPVPKFSLELLVENALGHAMIPGRDLEIRVTFEKRPDGSVAIAVCDDGRGFESIKKGIGLTNLEKRLQLLLDGSLEIRRENGRSCFTIILKEPHAHTDRR